MREDLASSGEVAGAGLDRRLRTEAHGEVGVGKAHGANVAMSKATIVKARTLDVAGAFLLLLALPPFTVYVWLCIRQFDGALVFPTSHRALLDLVAWIPSPTLKSVALYGTWFLLPVVLQIALPGKIHEGVPLADGARLKYKM